MPVIAVRATRGKWLRAEPVAALYEQGRVKHAGALPALEDEMCDFGLDGLSSGPLARPARRAGVGGDIAGARTARAAAGEGALRGNCNAAQSTALQPRHNRKMAMRLRLKNMFTPPETKASRTAKLLAFESGGRARWTHAIMLRWRAKDI